MAGRDFASLDQRLRISGSLPAVGLGSGYRDASPGSPGSPLSLRRLRNRASSRLAPTDTRSQASSDHMGSALSSSRSSKSRWPLPALKHCQKAELLYRTSKTNFVLNDDGIKTQPQFSRARKAPVIDEDEDEEDGYEGPVKNLPLEAATTAVLRNIYPASPGRIASSPKGASSSRRTSLQSTSDQFVSAGASRQAAAGNPTMVFRSKLLKRFSTLRNVFESFARTSSSGQKEVSRKDFMKFMETHFRNLDKSEHRAVFEFLDAANSGGIGVEEFNMACDAARSVKSIVDLRLKFVAYGYCTMRQALIEMETATRKSWETANLNRRLGFREFGLALSKVGIETEDEHRAIFSTLAQSSGSGGSGESGASTVSLAELSAALTAVGPPMILEEFRERLLAKFGSLSEAYNVLDLDQDADLTCDEFVAFAVRHIKVSANDASRAFRLIDIDDNKSISRVELIGALQLAEPGLYLESARTRVRQRWRSIEDAFLWYENALETYDPDIIQRELESKRDVTGKDSKSLEDFQYILSRASLETDDIATLFARIDIDGDGSLSKREFTRGIRLFAPSCALEDLRMRCLKNHVQASDAFEFISLERRRAAMSFNAFQKVLDDLDLSEGVNAQLIFDLVEQTSGGLLINELIIALDIASPGMRVLLPPKQRDAKASQEVREHLSTFQNELQDHRTLVRENVVRPAKMFIPKGRVSDPASYHCSSAAWQDQWGKMRPSDQDQWRKMRAAPQMSISLPALPSPSAPSSPSSRLTHEVEQRRPLPPPTWSEESHRKTMTFLRSASEDPHSEEGGLDYRGIEEYFNGASSTLASDKHLLQEKIESPFKQRQALKKAGVI